MQKHRLPLLVVLFLTLTLTGPLAGGVLAAPAADDGAWWGDYYTNRYLSGSPALSRYDDAVNFSWGRGSPSLGFPSEDFSVRWARDAWFAGGTYRFKILSDDGVRLWVGDELVVDEWYDRWATTLIVDHYIAAGTYPVRIEYYEHIGDATISVGWSRLQGGAAWYGEYFDNRHLQGWPVLMRNDRAIDFEWGNASPDPAIPADNFSVRWTRALGFDAGTYRFLTSTDDGARVWVDDALIVDAWVDQKQLNTHTGEVYLAAGQHTVTVEYYEHGGGASAHVWWQPRDTFAAWHGEYFDNRDFVGGPVLVRGDAANCQSVGICFDWGVGPPADWMPDDNFAARWTRTVDFEPGYYRFVVQADDGVRLWLDGSIIIDQWQDMDYELHYVDGTYLEGPHDIKLEYFEHSGHARVQFWWEQGTDDNAPPTALPAQTGPAAAGPATAGPGAAQAEDPWVATYYANTELSGRPVLSRIETSLSHNWGWGSPADAVPRNEFSARWRQSLTFEGGTYRFTTHTDDGVRLWVGDQLLIDSWRPMQGYRSATIQLSPGTHDVKMEYYERTGIALARLSWRRISP
jgi:hypothetical protein